MLDRYTVCWEYLFAYVFRVVVGNKLETEGGSN